MHKVLLLAVAFAACTPDPPPPPPHDWGPVRAWDERAAAPDCGVDGDAPLLDEVLAHAGLDRDSFAFLDADWDNIPGLYQPRLDDDFVLPLHPEWRDHSLRAGCHAGEVAAVVDGYAASRHGLAGDVREAADWLDRGFEDAPLNPGTEGSADFAAAVAALCAVAGGSCEASGAMPEDLGWALTPVLDAIGHALQTRYDLDEDIDWSDDAGDWTADDLQRRGGQHLLPHPDGGFAATDDDVQGFLRARNARSRMYRGGARLLFALQDVDWAAFAGRTGVTWELETDAGRIVVRDAADHEWGREPGDDFDPLLLLLDLGGDDLYLGPVGANVSADNAVSVAVDLGGDDTYGYEGVDDSLEFLLPSDEEGRYGPSTDFPNARQSLSRIGRQGAGLYGYGVLFDLGGGSDSYTSLRMSQGYAHLGVGVLFDDGGDDAYACEAGCQGAAQYGIGVLADGGGDDLYDAIAYSQGFGWVGGAGMLVDTDGADVYDCDHGHPDFGGTPGIYPSAQMPAESNANFCQGAGFGARGDTMSGGIGVLRDFAGDDAYSAGTFSQGSGYWQGTGLLSDGDGSDTYDAFYYVQGGAAHYALGVLADDGDGDDAFNMLRGPRYMQMGAGHDFSTGVLLNEAGDETYSFGGLAMGASNCNGMGLVVDVSGDDTYSSPSDYGWGMGNHSGECIDTRPESRSMGIMIDAGGADTYDAPASNPDNGWVQPANDALWGYSRHDIDYEHGGGIDGDGEPGVHPGG